MHLGSSELEPPLVLAILREEARGLVLRARDERHLVLIPVQVGDLPEVALESELRDPPSLVVSLPLVHGSVEGVSEDLLIVTQELRSIICVFVALHGSEGRLDRPNACFLVWLPYTHCEVERTREEAEV